MYVFENDPGHGWMGVPLQELNDLGIANDITTFSYFDEKKGIVWLEEDCDASCFLIAKVGTADPATIRAWMEVNVNDKNVNRSSRIRNLPAFRA